MAYAWTDRDFIAGTVALDFANTVSYRDDPARRFDRISGAEDLSEFARVALVHSDAASWSAIAPRKDLDALKFTFHLAVREMVDELFRPVARDGSVESLPYLGLLRMHRDMLGRARFRVGEYGIEVDPQAKSGFPLVLTSSAMQLVSSPELRRLKLCRNCGWIFIDQTRNGSRIWCDMLTCGNRAKQKRSYGRRSGVFQE